MKVRRPLEVKNLFLFIVRFPLWTNCHAKMSFRKTDLDQGVVSWGFGFGQVAVPRVYADLIRPEPNTWVGAENRLFYLII